MTYAKKCGNCEHLKENRICNIEPIREYAFNLQWNTDSYSVQLTGYVESFGIRMHPDETACRHWGPKWGWEFKWYSGPLMMNYDDNTGVFTLKDGWEFVPGFHEPALCRRPKAAPETKGQEDSEQE